ncbi:kelch motif-containing protein [Streptomyces sp. DSM 44915]|uniref:Kelch motif-containing protein n=1 Tax=Streptomyces chisholmiae TaxID=3075540 RepID=A0ABU2JI70_9ACTN|nr:kelch motif-containing protein [Streptomyces sp. DSM 44915]MDT0264691.1 kelch motif-containing protein [Streptomyces sp. DSM 44915]
MSHRRRVTNGRYRPGARLRKLALGSGVTLLLVGLNAPAAVSFAQQQLHEYRISRPAYQAEYGSWQTVDVPEEYRTNAIHAALLHTGKVLLIAGSGNNEEEFEAGTFDSVLWDPADNSFEKVPTPDDLFCAGHAQLPDGKLLVAGGTLRYEVLGDAVTHAGGPMLIKNEDPDQEREFPAGTRLRGPDGQLYETTNAITLPPADKREEPAADETADETDGTEAGEPAAEPEITVTASEERVFVTAVEEGEQGVATEPAQYEIVGLTGDDAANLYGLAGQLTLDDQDFQGIDVAYEFDPVAERYIPVDPMAEARWYPTLTTLPDGRVLTVSGLDEVGEVVPGINEIYDPETKTWSQGPERYFPTYPALFLTQGGEIFYTGSNAGYGPADEGRKPGIWNLEENTFEEVGGLSDADQLETSASLLLPPAQEQRFMVLGGGGVGESAKSTERTAIIDLTEEDPTYREGPSLPQGTRYLSSVLMPDDTVFTSGGSTDYRGRGESDILRAQFYDPAEDTFVPAAAPTVGRNYHSEALLLPDGRVATFGSDPLYGDKNNTMTGEFEKRIEVYTPPYLHDGREADRPALTGGPDRATLGETLTFATADADRIATARLMRPSAVTHTTDVEQRSIQLELERADGEVRLTVPEDPSLVPPGWYMVFVTDEAGTPSEASWVKLGG